MFQTKCLIYWIFYFKYFSCAQLFITICCPFDKHNLRHNLDTTSDPECRHSLAFCCVDHWEWEAAVINVKNFLPARSWTFLHEIHSRSPHIFCAGAILLSYKFRETFFCCQFVSSTECNITPSIPKVYR